MRYAEAVKVWNSHKKSVNPAHVYALPRKGTPEHAHVLHIQKGGHPEEFGKKKKAPKKFKFTKKGAAAPADDTEKLLAEIDEFLGADNREKKLAEIASKIKRSTAARRIAKAVKAHAAKKDLVEGEFTDIMEPEIDLMKLPEDMENIIKKMVGDPNKEKTMERFKTQMKGLEKFINELEKILENDRRRRSIGDLYEFFEEAPEYLQKLLEALELFAGERVDDDEFEDYIGMLRAVHVAGTTKFGKKVTIYEEHVDPTWGAKFGFSILDGFDVFALRLTGDLDTEFDRDEDEDEEREYDYGEDPYTAVHYVEFMTYERMLELREEKKQHEEEQKVYKARRRREDEVEKLGKRIKDVLSKSKVSKFLSQVAKSREERVKTYPPFETIDDFSMVEIEGEDYGVNVLGDVIDGDGKYRGHYDAKKGTLDRKAPRPRYWSWFMRKAGL